jgi:hypothetical protein
MYMYLYMEVNTIIVGWLILSSFMISQTGNDSSLLNPHASATMEFNPIFSPQTSPPSPTSAVTDASHLVSGATIDAIRTVNIRSHVPIILELTDPNFSDWRMFFDSTLSKFSLDAHVSASTPILDYDANWYKVDQCIVNWIYSTCSPEVMCIVCQWSKTDAFTL